MGKQFYQSFAAALPRRVVVLRALQLGDMFCAVPALRALRGAMPQAEIVLVGLPWARAFVERYDHYLDGFHEFPGYPGLPERPPQGAKILPFLAEMRAARFDLALQLHGSGEITNPLIARFGARRTVGFFAPGNYCPDPEGFCPYPNHGLEIHRLLRLMEFLGIETLGDELEFPLRESDYQALAAIEGARELRPGAYACIHPGASVPERRWPVERFAAVAQALADHGLDVVLTGSEAERNLMRALADALDRPVLDLAGRTSLGALATLLSQARLLVCNDTGVSHLAAALRIPSVVISTGHNPERWAPTNRRLHRVLCRDTGVSAAEVIRHAERFLEPQYA